MMMLRHWQTMAANPGTHSLIIEDKDFQFLAEPRWSRFLQNIQTSSTGLIPPP